MRVVLDANVLVSFLLTCGPTISGILKGWENKKFTLLVSKEIILEVEEVLARFVAGGLIKAWSAEALMRRLKKDSKIVAIFSQVTTSPNKKDNRYLACARDGKANYLVTGDKKHLLPLRRFYITKIISPREFVEILTK